MATVSGSAGKLDIQPWQTFNVEARLPELVKAIIRHENGIQPHSDATIADGLSLIFQ